MKEDASFDRVLALAREADTLRLARVEATRVRPHRAQVTLSRRVLALAAVVLVTFSTGPALLLAGSGAAAVSANTAATLPRTAWVCCGINPPHAPVVVEVDVPAFRPSPSSSPSAKPTPSPTRSAPAVTPTPRVAPVAPAVSVSPSPAPHPLVSSSADYSAHPSVTPSAQPSASGRSTSPSSSAPPCR